ncbi:MarR family winged helix-turn-helix transcriptional regulator [Thermotalea metallivorans]|uniref:HTH marR-type domain-containing protein n=1 Tax=Thermotalea metallivorans TaxID=520762 RepID=A0A140L6I0_9FIRM|nr:MarR family transcriptional regulator [Thermotalea metallivorans]KXG76155.1 hypothetical protein AN619_11120 [Thermotalea metallivorans]
MNYNNHAQQLRELVKVLIRSLGILEKDEASCCGITLGQCHALVEVGKAKTISLNELAELLNLDSSTMSRTVNNLVNANLLERKMDESDRRYIQIQLTEEGKKIFQTIEESMEAYFHGVLQAIDESKRDQVMESLRLLIDAIKKNKCC